SMPAEGPVISAAPFVSVAFMGRLLCPPNVTLVFAQRSSMAATPSRPRGGYFRARWIGPLVLPLLKPSRGLSRALASSVLRSIGEPRGRLMNEDRVGPPDDLDRVGRGARLVGGGQRQALIGAEHGHDAHGHSVLVLFRE